MTVLSIKNSLIYFLFDFKHPPLLYKNNDKQQSIELIKNSDKYTSEYPKMFY